MRRQRNLTIVNRTCRPLQALDDGIPIVIPPGYRKLPNGEVVGGGMHGEPRTEQLPEATARRAMNQNKARGTVNPDDILDAVFLLGVVEEQHKYPCTYVDDVDDPDAELFDRNLLPEVKGAVKLHTGVGRRRSRSTRDGGVIHGTSSGSPDVASLGARHGVGDPNPSNFHVAPDA
jgi:hypothetical protein